MSEATEALSRSWLFKDLEPKDIQRLEKFVRKREFAAGDVIVSEGDEGVGVFAIASGSVSVTRGSREVSTLGPGDVFGETALLDNYRRNATVTAREPLTT